MKTIILFIIALITFNACRAQDLNVNEILKKVNDKVSQIHNGEYKLYDQYVMINVGEDTTSRKESITAYYYKTNAKDSLIGYNIASIANNYEQVYNGNALYTNYSGTLTTTDVYKFPGEIKNLKASNPFMPFMQGANAMLQNHLKYKQPIILVGKAAFEGQECYKIQLGNDTDRSLVQYYISTASFLPLKSTIILTHINNKAKRLQTFNDWITDVKINNDIADSRFTKSGLSPFQKEELFSGSDNKPAQLLAVGSTAPDWELPTLNNTNIKLSDLKGKVVIMDFWFKACIPCQQQMIDLEKLNKKYDKQKVIIVGINTVDDPVKNKLALFLQNRKITMLSAFNGRSIEALYNAYTSPVLYIIGKNGKILYALDGESETLIKDVSKIIDQNL